jgi:periplasmic protein TonB
MEVKKNEKVDLNRQAGLFYNIGLCISLLLVLGAFSLSIKENLTAIDLAGAEMQDEQTIEEPPQTEQTTPIKPILVQPEIIEVPDEKKIEKVDFIQPEDSVKPQDTRKYDEKAKYVEPPKDSGPKEEKKEDENEIFTMVDGVKAEFPGGYKEFQKFIRDNYEYPRQARRQGLEGTISVQFVVEKEGTITDIKVLRGVSPECDAEAIRVLKKVPAWNPAQQRGRKVRNRITLPIKLKLGS